MIPIAFNVTAHPQPRLFFHADKFSIYIQILQFLYEVQLMLVVMIYNVSREAPNLYMMNPKFILFQKISFLYVLKGHLDRISIKTT